MFKSFFESFENQRLSFGYAMIIVTIMVGINLSLITNYFFKLSVFPVFFSKFALGIDNGFFFGIVFFYSLYKSYARIKIKPSNDDENVNEEKISGKREQQHQIILAIINALNYKPLEIPTGGKSKIKEICLKSVKIFTDSAFDHAWKEGTNSGLFRLLDSDKFSPK
jgi:hypothetical protein